MRGAAFIRELEYAAYVNEGQKLEDVDDERGDVFGDVLWLFVHSQQQHFTQPVVHSHPHHTEHSPQRCSVCIPERHNQYPRNVLIVVAVRYLVPLKILMHVHLRIGVFTRRQRPYIPFHDDLVPHEGVQQLEQGFRKGIGEHNNVDVIQ